MVRCPSRLNYPESLLLRISQEAVKWSQFQTATHSSSPLSDCVMSEENGRSMNMVDGVFVDSSGNECKTSRPQEGERLSVMSRVLSNCWHHLKTTRWTTNQTNTDGHNKHWQHTHWLSGRVVDYTVTILWKNSQELIKSSYRLITTALNTNTGTDTHTHTSDSYLVNQTHTIKQQPEVGNMCMCVRSAGRITTYCGLNTAVKAARPQLS